jgi:hypothetical protein
MNIKELKKMLFKLLPKAAETGNMEFAEEVIKIIKYVQSAETMESGGADVRDTIESKVITTVRDMIENSNYKGYAGLSNFLATYKKIHHEQFELPSNTKLSEYLKTFAELELFTHGGINTAMFVRFAKSGESE